MNTGGVCAVKCRINKKSAARVVKLEVGKEAFRRICDRDSVMVPERKIRFLPPELRAAGRNYKKLVRWIKLRRDRLLLLTLTFTDPQTTFQDAANVWAKFSRKFLSKQNSVEGWFRVIEGYDLPPWAFHVLPARRGSKSAYKLVRGTGMKTHIHALVEMSFSFQTFSWNGKAKRRLSAPKQVVDLWRAILRGKSHMGIGVCDLKRVDRTPGKLAYYLTDEARSRGTANQCRDITFKRVHTVEFSGRNQRPAIPNASPRVAIVCRKGHT